MTVSISGEPTLRLVRLIVVALFVATNDACARHAPPSAPSGLTSIKSATATVVVRNHHGDDLRVYVLAADGSSHRLGIVPKFGAATLALPRAIRLPAALRFVAMPLSHDEPQVTEAIVVDDATNLVFTVNRAASVSTLTKRP